MNDIFAELFESCKDLDIDYKGLQEKYKPEVVRLLIIGNAPPEWRYFYKEDVPDYDGLFLSVIEAMNPTSASDYEFKRTPEKKRTLLEEFKLKGGFLMDVYPQPEVYCRDGSLTYWLDDFKKRIKNVPLAPDAEIVLCHTNSHKLYSFFLGQRFNVHKFDCPVQRTQTVRAVNCKGTFVRKLEKIFKELKDTNNVN